MDNQQIDLDKLSEEQKEQLLKEELKRVGKASYWQEFEKWIPNETKFK